jgi:hypothetical protein
MLITKSGLVTAITGDDGVIGLAALLLVFISPGILGVLALNIGDVPTVLAFGVTGTLNVDDVPLAIGPGVVQLTNDPIVLQLQPLLAKPDGAVTPAGNVMFVVIVLAVVAVPTLLTVIGILLG